jgi:hypothetical protein
MRRPALLTVLLSVSVLGVGCAELDEQDTSKAPLEAADAVAVAFAPPEHVTSCVEQIKFGAFAGEPVWSEVWDSVGRTDDGASAHCTQLGTDNPGELARVHDGWLQVQAFLAEAAEAPAPEPAPPAQVAVQTYGTCKEAIAADGGNYRRGIDPEYDYYDDRDGDGIVCES